MSRGNTRVRTAVVRKRRRSFTALAVLTAALVALLALPAFAAAIQTYEVENNGDAGTKALCEAHITNECTLRGALEAAEADPGFDQIEFALVDFHGEVGESEIAVGSTPLPTITQPLLIFGQPIFGVISPTIASPSVGVTAAAGQPALKVASAGVTIESMAFGNGKVGIEVLAPTTGLNVRSSWFGLKLDGSPEPIQEAGIVIGPEADEATIGGTEESKRNVFADADTGIFIKGASKTKVQGNYIGVGPAGGVAGLGVGVRIIDEAGSPAKENEVGGTLTSGQAATTACDGPCNAIATENGEAITLSDPSAGTAASGPTTISGNYLGLEPSGVGTVGDSVYAVLAAPAGVGCDEGPGKVTVGGLAPTERNYIAGGAIGIAAESAENFRVLGNRIGVAPDGSAVEAPEQMAIELCAESITEPALVAGNQMMLGPDTLGIQTVFGQAFLVGNLIQGGYIGIETAAAGPGGGDVIQVNTVTGTDRQGILIQDELNVVTGNVVTGSRWSGIEIEDGGEHNRIGGDQPGEANTIIETGEDSESGAILIAGTNSSRNEVAANDGSGNFGDFIELVGKGGSETPNGLQPPVVATAVQSGATGTAAPNTTVRIFSKASALPGELGGLLAVVKANAAGAWTATYATQPVGTLVAATQTSDAGTAVAGTSEVSTPLAASADPPKPPEPEGGGAGGVGGGATGGGGPPPSTQPVPVGPKTKITKGPKKKSTATTATFKFKAQPAAGAKFECKLDGAKWARCSSPKTYNKLKPKKHTFRVRAEANGVKGAVTKLEFTVKA